MLAQKHTSHCEGYDKLKPFGFPIRGCVVGWCRKTIWLYTNKSSNPLQNIDAYYHEAVSGNWRVSFSAGAAGYPFPVAKNSAPRAATRFETRMLGPRLTETTQWKHRRPSPYKCVS
eukprot:gene15344-16919_t